MKEMKRFRIWDNRENKYLYIGFNNKTNWGRFPKEALSNKWIKTEPTRYEVHEYNLVLSKKLDINNKEVK